MSSWTLVLFHTPCIWPKIKSCWLYIQDYTCFDHLSLTLHLGHCGLMPNECSRHLTHLLDSMPAPLPSPLHTAPRKTLLEMQPDAATPFL